MTLVGQPLVRRQLMEGLRQFLEKRSPEKPLVMSFHGSTGTGKTFVSAMLVRHLFPEGLQSPHVHQFSPIVHFPHAEHVERYKVSAAVPVLRARSGCPRRQQRRSSVLRPVTDMEQRLHAAAEGSPAIRSALLFPQQPFLLSFSPSFNIDAALWIRSQSVALSAFHPRLSLCFADSSIAGKNLCVAGLDHSLLAQQGAPKHSLTYGSYSSKSKGGGFLNETSAVGKTSKPGCFLSGCLEELCVLLCH